jgi:hypothetical protein
MKKEQRKNKLFWLRFNSKNWMKIEECKEILIKMPKTHKILRICILYEKIDS